MSQSLEARHRSNLRPGRIIYFLAAASVLLAGCGPKPEEDEPLIQRGYLWQRDWTPQVNDAVKEADLRLDGLVLLGGEIVWEDRTPRLIKATIRWETLRGLRHPPALALRVAPFAGPFAPDDAATRSIVASALGLLADARRHGVEPAEFQLDFDCAQKKLAGYAIWLGALRTAIGPMRFVITALPAWLQMSEFPGLLRSVDGYVLQVHSVPTSKESSRTQLCDPELARSWAEAAAKLGRPFAIALPTYRCVAGFDAAGKLLGLGMDAVPPTWPPETRVLEFGSNANEIADLVRAWRAARPPGLRELLWYRIPVASDTRNWRWPTLAAVLQARRPAHRFVAHAEGESPLDLVLENAGESDEPIDLSVTVSWTGPAPVAAEALPGWVLRREPNSVTITTQPEARLRLAPGAKRGIGWLRFPQATALQWEVTEHEKTPR